jgi:dTMP kinase
MPSTEPNPGGQVNRKHAIIAALAIATIAAHLWLRYAVRVPSTVPDYPVYLYDIPLFLALLHSGAIVLADRYIYTAFARDAVRGCDRSWLRALYSYARPPDITFYFKVPLEVALNRILEGRPRLKYHEAGMDMGFSTDPYESFRIFQGQIREEYDRLTGEFDFTVIDANDTPERQQARVRAIVEEQIDLAQYRWRVPAPYAAALDDQVRKGPAGEPVEAPDTGEDEQDDRYA